MSSKLSSERGAILIQVAVASVVLIAFSMFVVDYGILWVSRGQAQNAADSGAMAGAVALGFDDFGNRDADGPASQSARQFALLNHVFGEGPDVEVDFKWDPDRFPDECSDDTCVRVDVYRTNVGGRTNPLPMMFGQLVGLTEQGVRATAIARAAFGNATECLKPWAVIDRWEENFDDGAPAMDPFGEDSMFDKYDMVGDLDAAVLDPDRYQAPSVEVDGDGHIDWDTWDPGTGFRPYNADRTFTTDFGKQIVLKFGSDGDFKFVSTQFIPLALGDFMDDSLGCSGITYHIGDAVEVSTEPIETMQEYTSYVVEGDGPVDVEDSLVGRDPAAYWDATLNDGRGGVAGSAFDTSPRIVAIPLVSPDHVRDVMKGVRSTVSIANIAGFFVEGIDADGDVVGRLVTLPGMLTDGNAPATPSSFLVHVSLIR